MLQGKVRPGHWECVGQAMVLSDESWWVCVAFDRNIQKDILWNILNHLKFLLNLSWAKSGRILRHLLNCCLNSSLVSTFYFQCLVHICLVTPKLFYYLLYLPQGLESVHGPGLRALAFLLSWMRNVHKPQTWNLVPKCNGKEHHPNGVFPMRRKKLWILWKWGD